MANMAEMAELTRRLAAEAEEEARKQEAADWREAATRVVVVPGRCSECFATGGNHTEYCIYSD
jgi:hypothetical protein